MPRAYRVGRGSDCAHKHIHTHVQLVAMHLARLPGLHASCSPFLLLHFVIYSAIVLAPQVIDTSELWRHRGGRKLSLRFLASYLLGANIQQGTAAAAAGHHAAAHHHHHHHHAHHHHHHHHNHHGGGPGGPGGGGPMLPPPQLGHDAIEDARTAMRLYHKYLEVRHNSVLLVSGRVLRLRLLLGVCIVGCHL